MELIQDPNVFKAIQVDSYVHSSNIKNDIKVECSRDRIYTLKYTIHFRIWDNFTVKITVF